MIANPARSSGCDIRTVVHVAREYGGLAGAGGIKDVVEGLARATAAAGIETYVFLPYYHVVEGTIVRNPRLKPVERCSFAVPMNYVGENRTESVAIHSCELQPNLTICLIHSRRYRFLFEKGGTIPRTGIYTYTKDEADALGLPDRKGKGYFDFFAMNVLLVKATLHALAELGLRPDVIHCHDGHAALLPAIAHASTERIAPYLRHVPTVITVHNAGIGYHQEVGDLEFASAICGIPAAVVDGCLLDGSFDPLLAGALFGSVINTVSENYARELQATGDDWRTGWFGHALAARGIRLLGVTNGIDAESFDPGRPAELGLAAAFSPRTGDIEGKRACKEAAAAFMNRQTVPDDVPAEARAGFAFCGTLSKHSDVPLLSFIGRLDEQKGYDVLADAVDLLFAEDHDVQLIGLGSGDPRIEARFKCLTEKFPGRIAIAIGYSPRLANMIYAAGDFFVVPSRFEPCGLTDFFAQLMGNVPIVHGVGGLVKVVDGHLGFSYLGGAPELLAALRRALAVYREPGQGRLRRIQMAAVENIYSNFTWERVLDKKYMPIYREAACRMKPTLPS